MNKMSHLNSFDQMIIIINTKQVPDQTQEGVNLAQASNLTDTLKISASPHNGKHKKRFGSRIHSTGYKDSNNNSKSNNNNKIIQITCSDTRDGFGLKDNSVYRIY